MDVKTKNLIDAAIELFESKDISVTQINEYLIEVFEKVFKTDQKLEPNEIVEEGKVEAKVDVKEGLIDIKRHWIVSSKEIPKEERFAKISIDDERLKDSKLKDGDIFIEQIDFQNLSHFKISHIKQLLVQIIREQEKLKIYEKYISLKGKLIKAKVTKTMPSYAILQYETTNVFLPRVEMAAKERFTVGDIIDVLVLDVEKKLKDAQIIASRSRSEFIEKLLKREIDDVHDEVIKIEKIVRFAGTKTKIAVSSTLPEVDPVGSIIGVRGAKIRPISDIISPERLDVIQYNKDTNKFIADSILPGRLVGIHWESKDEDKRVANIIVDNKNYLSTIGRGGINISLASKLVDVRLDVKTIETAKEMNIEWEAIETGKTFKKSPMKRNVEFELDEFSYDEFDNNEGDNYSNDNEEEYYSPEDYDSNENY